MSVVVCPTITATSAEQYGKQLRLNASLAKRLHIDLMDGDFAPSKSPSLEQIWWPAGVLADLHIMYKNPTDYLAQIVGMQPNLVIIHAESEVNHMHFAAELHKEGIKAGLALLAETHIKACDEILHSFDHILIFSGNLGYQGGSRADMALLEKVKYVKTNHPEAEIGWDGGVNDQNIGQLASGGVDVINIGGFIQKADHPENAYAKLLTLL